MIRNVKALTASSYISMFFLGFSATVIGAAARNIGLSPYEIGLLVAIQNVGFVISVAITGMLSDNFEKPKLLMAGSLLLAASLSVFFVSGQLWLYMLAMFFIGAGTGAYEGVTDAMLLELHPTREGLYISINHLFVTFGSISITLYMIFLQMNWRSALIQSAVVVLLLAVFFGLARLDKRGGAGKGSYRDRLAILTRERVVIVLFVCVVLAVGVEYGAVGMLTSYLMELRGFNQVTSKIGLIVFLVGILIGRLLLGYLARNEHIHRFVLVLFGLSFLTFLLLFTLSLGPLMYVLVFLAGASMSGLLPLMLTIAGLVYKDIAGTVLGAIKIGIPVGGIFLPLAMSAAAKYSSFEISLLIMPLAFLVAFFVFFFARRHMQIQSSPQEV